MPNDQLDGLTEDHCRWVLGEIETGEWCYCRAPRARKADGTYQRWMWCDEHRRRVVRTVPAYGALMRKAA
jgi:hypothetical protein